MSENKREAIIQAALELVAERGLHDAPMSLVAERANVSPGTIYHHFADKDEIINEAYRAVKIRFNRALGAGKVASASHKQAFRGTWMNAYHFYLTNKFEAQFLEQYENSPYYHPHLPTEDERQAEEYLPELGRLYLDKSGKHMIKDLPEDVLYELSIGVAVRLAKHRLDGLPSLDEITLKAIAEICYRSVVR